MPSPTEPRYTQTEAERYIDLLADKPGLKSTVEGMVLEAEVIRGHFTLRQALLILCMDRFDRRILSRQEAVNMAIKLI